MMPVFAVWSAPRARSTAFFRSMVERGDMVALHEPFCNLADHGQTDVDGRTFDSAASLLNWLHDQTHDIRVFLKDTTDRRHHAVLADRRLLAEARHAFLIRRPEEIEITQRQAGRISAFGTTYRGLALAGDLQLVFPFQRHTPG